MILLALGASNYQVPTILKAKSLGHTVITSDNVPDNPGHKLASISYNVDTTDIRAITEIAIKEKVDGAISPATDVSVPTAASVSESLNLPGPPLASALIMTDKAKFRDFLDKNNLPTPRSYPFWEPIFPGQCPMDSGPWIIKPNRSSGSKGVFRISNTEEFNLHALDSLGYSLDKSAVLEQYISGSQHTGEGIIKNGVVKTLLITDRFTAPSPYVATWAHKVPTFLAKNEQANIIGFLNRLLALLRLKDGPFDCDFVVTSHGEVYILEISPRIGGNSLSTLFDTALEGDLLSYAVSYALGVKNWEITALPEPKPVAVVLLGVMTAGRAVWDERAEHALSKLPGVLSFTMDIMQGDEIGPFINGRGRLGELLLIAENRQKLDELHKKAIGILNLKAI
ncbi:MAG: ATP-grasp domain-containing protein [Deltaproteobacteria bacterium]|jgi:biotin carboxylase|nr:ATP-grasp domain-containing protein [Deltaproteobacteria bacterium]